MNKDILKLRQNYPLWMKIQMTLARIRFFYEENQGEVYISFSGGKDSTVLLHLVRSIYPDVEAVFSDTGLEYPELKEHVKKFNNVTIIRPEITFKQFIETKGYPIISKQVCNCVRYAKKNIRDGKNTLRVRQINGETKGSKYDKKKWKFLLDAPFEVSEECCKVMKKDPIKKYEKMSNKKPIIGTLADESIDREKSYINTGCYDQRNNKLTPLGFWTEQDILKFIKLNNIEIPTVYGEVKKENGKYFTTGENRTGCIYCGMGVHLEKGENRFQRLKNTHPDLHSYCLNNLGMKNVLEYIDIKYD